jgi:hypothetical protein
MCAACDMQAEALWLAYLLQADAYWNQLFSTTYIQDTGYLQGILLQAVISVNNTSNFVCAAF